MLGTSVNYVAFVDVTTLVKQPHSNDVLNKSTSSQLKNNYTGRI